MVWMRRPRWVERGVQVQARVQGRVCQEPSTLEPRLEVGWGRTHTRHSPLAGGSGDGMMTSLGDMTPEKEREQDE